jgi:hypothetical protein
MVIASPPPRLRPPGRQAAVGRVPVASARGVAFLATVQPRGGPLRYPRPGGRVVSTATCGPAVARRWWPAWPHPPPQPVCRAEK